MSSKKAPVTIDLTIHPLGPLKPQIVMHGDEHAIVLKGRYNEQGEAEMEIRATDNRQDPVALGQLLESIAHLLMTERFSDDWNTANPENPTDSGPGPFDQH